MAPAGRRGGKFSKPTRGGGKHFSRDLQPLDKDGVSVGMWRDPADKVEESEEETSEEESSEESEDDAGPSDAALPTNENDMTREQRKELARKKKLAAIAKKNKKVAEVGDMPTSSEESSEEEEDELLANPNHSSKARAQARTAVQPPTEAAAPAKKDANKDNLSRREREALEKEQARERYQKLHAEGKTDEARADMARLKLIRQQREEAAARKKAEAEEKAEEQKKRQIEIEEREKKLRAAALGNGDAAKKKGKK